MKKERKTFILVMKFFTAIYIAGGILFYAFHSLLEKTLQIPESPHRFWVALAVSMMAMLAFASWKSSQDPDNKAFVQIHLMSKFISVAGFLLAFAVEQHQLAYLVGALTDAAVFVTVAHFYRSSHANR